MKIGCSSLTLQNYWKTTTMKEGNDHLRLERGADAAIQMIRWASGLGFRSIEFWIANPKHFSVMEQTDLSRIRQTAKDEGVMIEYFTCDFSAPWIFAENQEFILKGFERISRIARALDVQYIETVSPPVPAELTWYETYTGAPLPETIKLSSEFSWKKSWQKYSSAIKGIMRVLDAASLKLALEPRPREILSGTDSLLRLFDAVESDSVGGLLDTSHLHLVKEVPSISIHKLGKRLFGVQASENDGITAYHWPPGQGEIDWMQVVKSLIAVGYNETISIDVTGMDVEREALEGKEFIKKIIERQVIEAN